MAKSDASLTTCPRCGKRKLATGENVAARYFCLNPDCKAWTADGIKWTTDGAKWETLTHIRLVH